MKCIAITLAALVFAAPPSQDKRPLPDQVQELREEVAKLKARMTALEGAAQPLQSPSASARLMQIESIATIQATGEHRDQIADLRSQADEKNDQADNLEAQRRKLDLDPDADNTHSRDSRARSAAEARRQYAKLGEDITKLRAEADKFIGQARRLEREDAAPRQVIKGWNGSQTIILNTTEDCARTLSNLGAGAFITWEGVITDHAADAQEWSVSAVNGITKPATFTPRSVAHP